MRQRLKLGQAILHDPDVLILDEPLTGLDPLMRRDVIRVVRELGDAGVVVDVENAFFSLRVAEQDSHLLRFRWQGSVYRLRALPMGWALAPRVFHCVHAALMASAVARVDTTARFANYIDDTLLIASSVAMANDLASHVRADVFEGSGLTESAKTRPNAASATPLFTGFVVDFARQRVILPEQKRKLYIADVQQCLDRPGVVERVHLETIIGRLVHARAAVPDALLWLPALYAALCLPPRQRRPLCCPSLKERIVIECEWWVATLSTPCWASFAPRRQCSSECATDGALDTQRQSWAAAFDGEVICGSVEPQLAHIGLVEAYAVSKAVEKWRRKWRGQSIRLHVDNAQLFFAIASRRSTGDAALAQIVRTTLAQATQYSITLVPSWVPSADNDVADAYTRPDPSARAAASARWHESGNVIRSRHRSVGIERAPPNTPASEGEVMAAQHFQQISHQNYFLE
jgi:hypothetical protein